MKQERSLLEVIGKVLFYVALFIVCIIGFSFIAWGIYWRLSH
jgi:hypothetical protein